MRSRAIPVVVWFVACAIAAGCGNGVRTPIGPSGEPRLLLTRFLAFGDSLTLGEVTVPSTKLPGLLALGGRQSLGGLLVVVPSAAYPTVLRTRLVSTYPAQATAIEVVNAGKAGEHPHEALPRFVEAFEAARPEVVLLWEGINSVRLYGSDLPTDGLAAMVSEAQSRGALVFLANLLPMRPGTPIAPSEFEFQLTNTKIRALAAARGAVFVNLHDTLLPELDRIIGVDGIHPTEAGYARIADVFFAAIRANLEVR